MTTLPNFAGTDPDEAMFVAIVTACNLPTQRSTSATFYPELAGISRFSVRYSDEIRACVVDVFRALGNLEPTTLAAELTDLRDKQRAVRSGFFKQYPKITRLINTVWPTPGLRSDVDSEAAFAKAVQRLATAMDKLEAVMLRREAQRRPKRVTKKTVRMEPYAKE